MQISYVLTITSIISLCIHLQFVGRSTDFRSNDHPFFQKPTTLEESSFEWNWIKRHPNEALRKYLFTMESDTFSRKAVTLAMECGANVNTEAENSYGIIPGSLLIEHAIYLNQIGTVKWLLEHNASLNRANTIQAFTCATTQMVNLLLQHDPTLIDTVAPDGFTALHFACLANNTEVAKLLVKRKPNLLVKADSYTQLPFHVACEQGHVEIIRFLHQLNPHLIHIKNGLYSPLHLAVIHNRLDAVKVLIELNNFPLWTRNLETCLAFAQHNCPVVHNFLSKLKAERTQKTIPKSQLIVELLQHGATSTLAAQCLLGTLNEQFPYPISLLTQSSADPSKVVSLCSTIFNCSN